MRSGDAGGRRWRAGWLVVCAGLAGCGYGASKTAHLAQSQMIGMSVNDLQACAGPPDKTTKLNADAQVFTYEYKPSANGGLTIDLPLSLGGIAIGGSGTYCRADLRLVENRVTELHYTGDDDATIGSDAVCAPLVRGCVRQPEPTMSRLAAGQGSGVSAFHPPSVPAQPTAAETP